MTHRRVLAALAAIVMLSCTACGAKTDEAVMTNADIAPVLEAGEEAAGAPAEDGKASFGMKAEEGGAAEEEAMEVAPAAVMADMDGAADAVYDAGFAAEPAPGDVPAADAPIDITPVEPDNRISVLTAGEWSDHANWGFFSNLVNTGVITFPSFGLEPTRRVSVHVTDAAGAPAKNQTVQLLDVGGEIIWQAVTDQNGQAYLFETQVRSGVSVHVEGTAEDALLPVIDEDEQGAEPLCSDRSVECTVGESAPACTATQILFIVDTTGSMGDEMLYLQSDFAAIAQEVGDAETEYGTLFYKDISDAYVTRAQGFTGDVSEIASRLSAENASGGGDEPEAVAQAFTEAFVNTNWREDAVKIAFLIYDAPPHSGTDSELQTAIESAAKQGIHLVPVVSSNGSRETELFGRACAIMTNGSYVFLTDDSGVGGSHLEPIIGDYEVEKLHDIIVRIIETYKQ